MSFGLHLPPQQRVFGAFAIYSFCMGNIFPRFPDIQHSMGVPEGALGLGLIGTPIGTLISLTFATLMAIAGHFNNFPNVASRHFVQCENQLYIIQTTSRGFFSPRCCSLSMAIRSSKLLYEPGDSV